MSDVKSQSFNGSDKHVQVIARPRPLSDNEKLQNGSNCLSINETRREIIVNCKTSTTRFFSYDHVFGFQARQEDVFKVVVAPIVDEVLKGYSSTIFAYGQTGSGKTHTMLGKFPMDKLPKDTVTAYMTILESEAGIMPRAIHHIFQGLQRLYVDFTVKITYLELYNEELTDLLADSTNEQPEKIKIYEDKDKTNIIVGAIEATCETPFDAFKVLIKGSQRRQTAETLMNASSSRSHSIFTLTVTMKDAQGDIRLGKLHLVDLAGSENISRSGATDKRAREAGTINQSLLTLGRVISALISNEKHICYRDSKLTRILQDSLCGKTITSIIITLSPANEAETLSTLEYGHRARSLKIRPEINQLSSKDVAREYIEEIRRLRQELDAKREADGIPYSQYLALKNQMTLVQTLSDSNQEKIEQNEQQFEQYRNEIETLRRQLVTQQQEYRNDMNERKEILALNRHRYDELVQITNKALTFREQALNAFQQLRTVRSSSTTLADQHLNHCRSIRENLQTNLQEINNDLQTVFLTCNRLIGQVLTITTNISQEMFVLNEKIRAVLSLAFQNFHSIFDELTTIYKQFQSEFDKELKTLVDLLAREIKPNADLQQEQFARIQEETKLKLKNSFQEILVAFGPSTQILWNDLHSFLAQRFNQMINQEFRRFLSTTTTTDIQCQELDLNIIQTKWLTEQEKSISIIENDLEQTISHLFQTFIDLTNSSHSANFQTETTKLLQHIHDRCHQHGEQIRQFIEHKFQHLFAQIRDEYEQQCSYLLNNIEQEINQINRILQEINSKFDGTTLFTNNEAFLSLNKQLQRIDVTIKNFEYDWGLINQSNQFEYETILPAPSQPKADAMNKYSIENKENFLDANLMPCRPKNDTPFF